MTRKKIDIAAVVLVALALGGVYALGWSVYRDSVDHPEGLISARTA